MDLKSGILQDRLEQLRSKGSSEALISFKSTAVKGIEIWAIIVVPLIMTLSRGHTGKIKGQL